MYQFSYATFHIDALLSLVGYFECLDMAERLKVMYGTVKGEVTHCSALSFRYL